MLEETYPSTPKFRLARPAALVNKMVNVGGHSGTMQVPSGAMTEVDAC